MNDISDEALGRFDQEERKRLNPCFPRSLYLSPEGEAYLYGVERGWLECRRRAEEREHKAFEAGYDAGGSGEYSDDALEEYWHAYKEGQK